MSTEINQNNNSVSNGDVVGNNKNVITNTTNNYNYTPPKTRLSTLFENLKAEFDCGNSIETISDELKIYSDRRDTIGLEQKLIDANLQHLIDDAAWYKEQYFKKLTKFQFFEPAQEIHSFLLGVVLEKFVNIIYPMMRANSTEIAISERISYDIVNPIIRLIQENGCEDVMKLSATDINGMIYFLTGKCHIKWNQNDRLSPSL